MYDVMTNVSEKKIKCLDHGFVELVDVMPRLVPDDQKTADAAVVQAARVSYGAGTKTVNEDRGLIRYLMRARHSSPFEMIEFKFHVSMPIFVCRQFARHRMSSTNETSGRYSILPDKFYYPEIDNIRKQSTRNKQCSEGSIDSTNAEDFLDILNMTCKEAYEDYEKFLEAGIGREQARMILPINLFTELYWKIDLHNLFHFLGLRCDKHAQWEIRVFAEAMLELIKPIVPWCVEAWEDYHPLRGAVLLTRLEADAIRAKIGNSLDIPELDSTNKREVEEWNEKSISLGFNKKEKI